MNPVFCANYIHSVARFKLAIIVYLSVCNIADSIFQLDQTSITNLQLVGHVDQVSKVGPVANVSLSSSISGV